MSRENASSGPLRSGFLRANVTLGLPTLVRLLAGIAKSKTSALLLGTAGVGVVSIGSQLQLLGVSASSMGVAAGYIRHLSASVAKGDRESKLDLLGTSLALQCLLNGPLLILGLALARPLARLTFGSEQDFHYLIPILITIPLQSLMVSHLNGVFYAHGKLQFLARASAIAAIAEALAYILLVRKIGIAGAFWGVTVGMVIWVLLLVILASRLERLRDLFHFRFRTDIMRTLISDGVVMSVTGGVTYLANALIRIHITRSLGVSSAGIYQVVMALTAYYIPYFTNGVWGRLFPKISATGLDDEGCMEWSEALILTSVLCAAAQLGLMVVAGLLVSLFYSHDFAAAIPLTPIQFLGDFFYLVSVPCLGVIMGLSKMRTYLVTWITYYFGFYVLATFLTERLGLRGTVLAYLISNFALAAHCLSFFARSVRSSGRVRVTLVTLVVSALVVAVEALLCLNGASLPYRLVLPVAWGFAASAVLFLPKAKKMLLAEAA